jgi:hypothetical protein
MMRKRKKKREKEKPFTYSIKARGTGLFGNENMSGSVEMSSRHTLYTRDFVTFYYGLPLYWNRQDSRSSRNAATLETSSPRTINDVLSRGWVGSFFRVMGGGEEEEEYVLIAELIRASLSVAGAL